MNDDKFYKHDTLCTLSWDDKFILSSYACKEYYNHLPYEYLQMKVPIALCMLSGSFICKLHFYMLV